MGAFSVLILIIYLTIAVYVIYQARASLLVEKEEKVKAIVSGKAVIQPLRSEAENHLDQQLESLNLKGEIKIDFGKEVVMDMDKLIGWTLAIENNTTTYALFVDWQQSSLTNLLGQARSLGCVTPNNGLSQTPSLTPPLGKLKEVFSIYTTGETPIPFVNSSSLFKLFKDEKVPPSSITINLRLVMRLQETGRYTNSYHLIGNCTFRFRPASLEDLETIK